MELTLGSSAVRSGEAVTCSASAVVSAWYDRYGTDVLRLCYMYMRNRSDAEDALQETFLKIWRKLDCYEGRNHCTARSWIMKVARNTCMDLLRKSWRVHGELSVADEDLAALGKATREDRELILDVMNLPEKYRSVILMVCCYGMTIKEAAETLQISQSSVHRRLEKARAMIQD